MQFLQSALLDAAVVLTIINLLMLIVCLNLANLLLARATARSEEREF